MLTELDQLNLDPDTKTQVTDLVQTLLNEAKQAQEEVKTQALKVQALTMELPYLRRIQFGKMSESLSPKHPNLFEETLQSDLAAVNAEIEQLDPPTKADQIRPNHHVLALVASHYRITCRVLNTATSQNLANVINAAIIWLKSANILAISWMWNQPNSSFTATSAHNMPESPPALSS